MTSYGIADQGRTLLDREDITLGEHAEEEDAKEVDGVAGEETSAAKQTTALAPVREQVVQFYGDNIPVAQTPDGEIYVPLRPLTDFLGLAFGSQTLRVRRDEVL